MTQILIADDNKQITSILEEYAKKEGYSVTVVYDGTQVLEKFKNSNYDLLLLDVMMPKMDGFEVVREIRKTSDVPIIMITARGEDFEKIMGLDIGADDYIVKPFSPQEVMARSRAVLRRLSKDSIKDNK
ncbi:MAG: response regulator, partial [Clostridia bacterium]|nr:response regulator [Clostridia bacterium]